MKILKIALVTQGNFQWQNGIKDTRVIICTSKQW